MTSWLFAIALCCAGLPFAPAKLDSIELRDVQGAVHTLAVDAESRALVVVFVGVECPLAKLYADRLAKLAATFRSQGVRFVAIDPNPQDSADDLAHFEKDHPLGFPLLADPQGAAAELLGARRTPEVFVLDRQRRIVYRGRIDDQFTISGRKPAPVRNDLAEALTELLAGKPVSVSTTSATGCAIPRREPARKTSTDVTYSKHIAPILQKHCVQCHRSGQVAPFTLTDFEHARDWAPTIREVVAQRRMPPWHADPHYGHFANDPSLNAEELVQIEAWASGGCPEGNPADLPPPAKFSDDWAIGKPDVILSMPEPFRVPSAGVIEYQLIEIDPHFKTDTWVSAAEIRPGNPSVVHHATVYLKPPGGEASEAGTLGSMCLVATAPGTPALVLPAGMAKLVPAGWKFLLVVHYAAIGREQTDITQIGLRLIDARNVRREVATRLILDEKLSIPPGVSDYRVEHSWLVPRDVLLLSMFPHMHARGKAFRYEADYPNGRKEILLDVPRYDVDWQNRYDLTEPKLLPAGTLVRCTAHYDNSAANPRNPDPTKTVLTGPQSWDEMFNGYMDIVAADEPSLFFSEKVRGVALMCVGVLIMGIAWRTRPREG
jgi:peroxiredoxin